MILPYRLRETLRPATDWLGANTRCAALAGALALALILYALFFLDFRTREMIILHRPAPQWRTVVFGLDRDYAVTTIEVVELTGDGPGRTMWKLRRAEDAPALSTFAYAQPLPGMEARVAASPLEPGRTYRLLVTARGARGEADFDLPAGDPRRATTRGRD